MRMGKQTSERERKERENRGRKEQRKKREEKEKRRERKEKERGEKTDTRKQKERRKVFCFIHHERDKKRER